MGSLVIYWLRQWALGEKLLSCYPKIFAELLEAMWVHLDSEGICFDLDGEELFYWKNPAEQAATMHITGYNKFHCPNNSFLIQKE